MRVTHMPALSMPCSIISKPFLMLILITGNTTIRGQIKMSIKNGFEMILQGILSAGMWVTRITQEGNLSRHLMIIFVTLAALLLSTLAVSSWVLPTLNTTLSLALLGIMIALATLSLLVTAGVISNLVSLSVLGIFMSVFFIIQGAPDVAMAQIMIEILTVILIVIALRKSRINAEPQQPLTSKMIRLLIAGIIGAALTIILLLIVKQPFDNTLSQYFIAHSLPQAYGRNVVNVILVDFRSLDTFGEALVILATGLGVWLIMRHYRRATS